jgi:L-alanine-DL-glutamate epimerase-like enolase superfamily enzyme
MSGWSGTEGFSVFYLKVGIDVGAEMEMVRTIREATGENTRIRLDANGAWAVNEAIRNVVAVAGWHQTQTNGSPTS